MGGGGSLQVVAASGGYGLTEGFRAMPLVMQCRALSILFYSRSCEQLKRCGLVRAMCGQHAHAEDRILHQWPQEQWGLQRHEHR